MKFYYKFWSIEVLAALKIRSTFLVTISRILSFRITFYRLFTGQC